MKETSTGHDTQRPPFFNPRNITLGAMAFAASFGIAMGAYYARTSGEIELAQQSLDNARQETKNYLAALSSGCAEALRQIDVASTTQEAATVAITKTRQCRSDGADVVTQYYAVEGNELSKETEIATAKSKLELFSPHSGQVGIAIGSMFVGTLMTLSAAAYPPRTASTTKPAPDK